MPGPAVFGAVGPVRGHGMTEPQADRGQRTARCATANCRPSPFGVPHVAGRLLQRRSHRQTHWVRPVQRLPSSGFRTCSGFCRRCACRSVTLGAATGVSDRIVARKAGDVVCHFEQHTGGTAIGRLLALDTHRIAHPLLRRAVRHGECDVVNVPGTAERLAGRAGAKSTTHAVDALRQRPCPRSDLGVRKQVITVPGLPSASPWYRWQTVGVSKFTVLLTGTPQPCGSGPRGFRAGCGPGRRRAAITERRAASHFFLCCVEQGCHDDRYMYRHRCALM